MSMSKVYLCLIFLTFLTSPPVLCSRSPKLVAAPAAMDKNLEKTHVHPPALLVSESNKVDSPSSMSKIDDEPATSSAIAGFFRYRFPFQGWPFHKYAPFPPANPSVPTTPATGAEEEESEKVPSSPSKGNRDGSNP
ncbi:hypothetical protein EUTSA_v10026545mg [Eutrema salsugineum]|uniref:Uncharacterized protein n=1 Tax=Eutrema salsugineum TaxID=72664 RepID=V4MFP2_EUTSA|nr:uncharacterized protein LOC18029228 [Eutrema salsugineum]ESQ55319.1 hypothetical protein EUTSA_v10026545mg [Eutrema salsugineum]